MSDVVLIAGSPGHPSRSGAALDRLGSLLRLRGVSVERVTVRDLPAEALLWADAQNPAILGAIEQVRAARAVVVATPVYKAAYSGVLKAYLDLLPQDALAGKVALPVASGGSVAHLLALDYAVKPLLGALGARHILSGVYLSDGATPRNAEGGYDFDAETTRRLEVAASELAPLVRRRPTSTATASSEALTLATALL